MKFKDFLKVFLDANFKQIEYSPYSTDEYDDIRTTDWYYIELKNLLYTIPFHMKQLYAHVLAFDIYNCILFKEISGFYKKNQYDNIYQLLNRVSNNNHHAKERQAFHKASKITFYIYNCRYSDLKEQFVDDKLIIAQSKNILTQFHYLLPIKRHTRKLQKYIHKAIERHTRKLQQHIYKTINESIQHTGYTYNYHSEKQKKNLQFQGDDNLLRLLQSQASTGLIDRFVSHEELSNNENYEDSVNQLDSHYQISKVTTRQISNLRDQLEGIRKIKFESDLFNLLRGQYAYLNNPRIFFSLYARKELLTYNFPTNIISNQKTLISLITVCKPEIKYLDIKQLLNSQNIPNILFDKEKLLPDSFIKLFYLEMIYDFINLTQIKKLKNYFDNSFIFTYRLQNSISQNEPCDLSEQTIKEFWLDKMELPAFKNYMHFTFPQIFTHEDSFVHKKCFEYLYDCLEVNDKDVSTDLCINILFFIGYHNEDSLYKEIMYLLQKKYASKKKFKAIIFMLDQSLCEGKLYVFKKRQQTIFSENRFPLAVAHKIVESILFT